MTYAKFVAQILSSFDIKTVFTVPGGGCIHLIDAFEQSPDIELVGMPSEHAATVAASAYALAHETIGVVLVTTGPGSTNAMTGVAASWIDSVPLLVISGQVQQKDINRGRARQKGFQEVSINQMVQPIVKKFYTCTGEFGDKEEITYVWEKMIEEARCSREGPVWIEVPLDVQGQEVTPSTAFADSGSAELDADLQKCKRPLLLIGRGVHHPHAVSEFLTYYDMPLMLTWRAIDYATDDFPNFIGRPGIYGQPAANQALSKCDLLICVGARLDAGQIAWDQKSFAPQAKKYIVDIDSGELEKLSELTHASYLCLESYEFFDLNFYSERTWPEWLAECQKSRQENPVVTDIHRQPYDRVNIYNFLDVLFDLAPENTMFVPSSSGAASEIFMQVARMKKGQRVINHPGLGSMGFALASAIGVYFSTKQPVICIEGDGSAAMSLAELQFIKDHLLPIKVFLLQNDGYGSIQATQDKFFGRRALSSFSTGLIMPDFGEVTHHITDNDRESMSTVIQEVLDANGHCLCAVDLELDGISGLLRVQAHQNDDGTFSAGRLEDISF